MKWERHGLLYKDKKSQLPVVTKFKDYIRIFYSNRDSAGKSFANYIDLEIGNLDKIIKCRKNILKHGSNGDYDVAGVMPMQQIENKLFYIGWTIREDVPYFNYTSIAEINGDSFTKIGPILSPDCVDQGYSGTFFALKKNDHYLGYYLSGTGWIEDENGKLNPTYNIKIAKSHNLIKWEKLGLTAIECINEEAGISGSTIVYIDNIYHMWFSARKSKNFRNSKSGAYKIKHAWSIDGINWTRDDLFGLEPDGVNEKIMVAYPSVEILNEKITIFYNGDGFGTTGIFYASIENNEFIKFFRNKIS